MIVGKTTMAVVQDAQGIAKGERAVLRERVVGPGPGKQATQERMHTELVSVPAWTSDESDGEVEDTRSAYRRDAVGQPIHAVVVRRWDTRVPKGEGTVSLTNANVGDPFAMFDRSDWRRVSETGMLKEGKHPWHLLCFPKRTEAAVVVHCFSTLLVMALCPALRFWQAQAASPPTLATEVLPTLRSALRGGEGTAHRRQRFREEHREKLLVFSGQTSGMFHFAACATASASPSSLSRLSTGRSSTLWHQPLILLSKRQGASNEENW